MDKPKSLSLKDFIIRKMSIKMNMPEKILDSVISHQFQSANNALYTANSIEIAGFGKFLFNQKKAEKHFQRMLEQKGVLEATLANENVSEQKKHSARLKLDSLLKAIDILKPKINDKLESNLRGLEEQSLSPLSTEGSN
jgi:nucleoid DNA-binding protein